MSPNSYAAILLRISGVVLFINTVPLILSWFELAKHNDAISNPVTEEVVSPAGSEPEDWISPDLHVSEVFHATATFPDFRWQITAMVLSAAILVFGCNPLAKLVLIGITRVDPRKDNASDGSS